MQPDTRLGHYRIIGKLGRGGMGEVYQAEDSRLKRNVAIKVLPAELASDPERLARLEREAQVLAALEHPNVAAVYGLEESDDVRFLVMQLASGMTLDDRVSQGAIPVEEAIPIAVQIARGLEAAHERGIVHRDLKPANVMIDEDGNVKLLDFGLAKPTGSTDKSVELTASPTMMEATQAGVILGTASYMSPEQARGRAVDKRTDIWAWGCVVYEMLTGERLFGGDSISDVIASVLRQDVDLSQLPPDTPANLRRLLGAVLVRDPAERLRDIGDARIALAHDDSATEVFASIEPRRPRATLAAAVVVGILLGALGASWSLRPAAAPVLQFDIAPDGLQTGAFVPPTISPDGRRVLYRADDRLWLRDLSQSTGRPVPSTEGVEIPIWSPDSTEVAYVVDGYLWTQDLDGGAPVRVANVPPLASGAGLAWDPTGRLLFVQGSTEIMEIPVRGGELTPLIIPDPERAEGHFHRAIVLPDGSLAYVLHRLDGTADTIAVERNGERREVLTLEGDYLADLAYSPVGALLFSRLGPGGDGIWVVPFDSGSLETTGTPVMLVPRSNSPSLSADGTRLLFDPNMSRVLDGRARIGLVGDLSGRSGDADDFIALIDYEPLLLSREGQRISPDGKQLAFALREGGTSDLWLLHLERGTRQQLTNDAPFDAEPVWSTDGQWIYYSQNDIVTARVRADGSGTVEVIGTGRTPAVLHGADRLIVRRRGEGGGDGTELWYLDATPGGTAVPFRVGRNAYGTASVARDGDLVAYASAENADWEVVVEDLRTGQRWQVSEAGGRSPRWAADGDLYFIAPPRTITRVAVSRDGEVPSFGPPEAVTELTPSFGIADVMPVQTEDGLRFLSVEQEEVIRAGRLVIVLNADQLIREALER